MNRHPLVKRFQFAQEHLCFILVFLSLASFTVGCLHTGVLFYSFHHDARSMFGLLRGGDFLPLSSVASSTCFVISHHADREEQGILWKK